MRWLALKQARGSKLGLATHGRLFILSDNNEDFPEDFNDFTRVFSIHISLNSPEGSEKFRWAMHRARSAPLCVLKSLK
jgi:hypothetical protein